MPSSRTIKKRIRSTKNIAQITKAMEAVSAVKMRKSQEIALRSRPYALAALEILKNLSGRINETDFFSPLLEKREIRKICLLVVTSDKGLCGAFNSNVLRRALDFTHSSKVPVEFIAIGKKSVDFLKKRNFSLCKEITGVGDFGAINETKFLSDFLTEVYKSKRYDEIFAVYASFLSVMKQEVILEKLLPFTPLDPQGSGPKAGDEGIVSLKSNKSPALQSGDLTRFTREGIEKRINEINPMRGQYAGTPVALGGSSTKGSYLFEPSPEEVLSELLPLLLEIQVYHIILEANASEHSARMVAMKNASENASELINDLALLYNKARQAQITKELSEITAGAAALNN